MDTSLDRFVPRVLSEWDLDDPGAVSRHLDGTLCFVDISGFTALSERLARRGRVGAEELTEVLNHVFGTMLRIAYDRGGSLLKFGGDALLLLFEGDRHALQGVAAAIEMRAALREAATVRTSVGRIHLRMSVGLHTGTVDLYRVGRSHRELIITGPASTITAAMEASASAGEILMSPELAAVLPPDALGQPRGDGYLLRWRKARIAPTGPIRRRDIESDEVERCLPARLRAHLGSGGGLAEHRVASVGFIKYQGVAGLARTGGTSAVAAALDELINAVQEAADAEAVTFLATDVDADGGKVILSSGVPSSQEDDEGRILRTLRRVADAGSTLSLRIGVNRGHVFSGEIGTDFRSTYTVMGDTVNLAARLMAAAPVGAVYAAAGVLDRAATLYAADAIAPFRVKGKTDPIRAYQLGPESGIRRSAESRDLPFVGRRSELAAITSAIEAARRARPSAFTISGPNGIGKSRLAAEALNTAGDQVGVFVVRAEPYGADNPFWALRDPLRDLLGVERSDQEDMSRQLTAAVSAIDPALTPLLPLLGDAAHIDISDTPGTAAIDARFRTERVAEAVTSLLRAVSPGPMVLVLEDCHWIDEASALVTRRLATAGDEPWVTLCTRRPGGGDRHFPEPIGTELPLRPLSDEEARTLAVTATAATPLRTHELDGLIARAEGNPLFLTEMLRLVRRTGSFDSLPDSVDAVVGAEIDTLAPLTRQILRYASVLGRSFRRVVFDEVLTAEGVTVNAATRRELSRFIEDEGGRRMRFRHAIVRDAAYEALSYRKRRELHRAAGRAIERLAGGETDAIAEFLAIHYALSGDAERAWHFAQIAGDKAARTYANTEAAAHYRRALLAARQLPGIAPPRIARVWTRLGEVEENAGRFEDAREAYGRALATDRGDPADTADLYLRRARTWMFSGHYAAAKRNISLGRSNLGPGDDDRRLGARARLDSFAARIHIAHGDPGAARSAATAAVAAARRVGEDEALARAYMVLDWANVMGGRTDAPRHSEEALAIFERLGFVERASDVMNNLGGFAYLECRWDDAVGWYRRSMDAARRAGNDVDAANIQANTAEVLVGQRHYAEAARLAADASRALRAANVAAYLPFVDLQSARAAAGLGHTDGAIAEFRRLFDQAVAAGDFGGAAESAVSWADALTDAGHPEEALGVLDRLAAAVTEAPQLPAVGRARGRAAAGAGRPEEAIGVLEAALHQAGTEGAIFEEGLILEALSDTRRRAGVAPDPASDDRMRQIFGELGIVAAPADPAT